MRFADPIRHPHEMLIIIIANNYMPSNDGIAKTPS